MATVLKTAMDAEGTLTVLSPQGMSRCITDPWVTNMELIWV